MYLHCHCHSSFLSLLTVASIFISSYNFFTFYFSWVVKGRTQWHIKSIGCNWLSSGLHGEGWNPKVRLISCFRGDLLNSWAEAGYNLSLVCFLCVCDVSTIRLLKSSFIGLWMKLGLKAISNSFSGEEEKKSPKYPLLDAPLIST